MKRLIDSTTIEGASRRAQKRDEAFVAVLAGGARELVPLIAGQAVSIGRSRSSHIVIDDPAASRLQATLHWDGEVGFTLSDKSSRNGTYVGDERVCGELVMRAGEVVRVGAARMTILLHRPDESIAPTASTELSVDPTMLPLVAAAERAARTDATLLLFGETGVGKEVLARHVHQKSGRRDGIFLAINCGAIPEDLAEATLFGHERGAFTGALERRPGVFEAAEGGTLLLDEVGELSPRMQARLLRVLEQREVVRVGSHDPVAVDVRVVAATHRELAKEVEAGRFREDLLYRLAVVTLTVPPLRERPLDIEYLARRFCKEIAAGQPIELTDGAMQALRRHTFPGNVRELRNIIEGAIALRRGDRIDAQDLPRLFGPAQGTGGPLDARLDAVERKTIADALAACEGNQSATARRLGITRRALIYRMEKHGLKPRPAS